MKKKKNKNVATSIAVTSEEAVAKDITSQETAVEETEISKTEATEAETTEAETSEAETSEAETTEAETTEAEISEAETTEAETTEAEVSEAETTEPETSEAEVSEAEVSEAETTEPEESRDADKSQDVIDDSTKLENQVEAVEDNESNDVVKSCKLKSLLENKKFVITGSILLFLIVLYGCLTYYYSNRLFIGTTINGLDCSNMTAEEADAAIRDKVEAYSLSIEFRDGTTEVISGDSIEYKYISDDSVYRLLDVQNPFAWITGIFDPSEYEVPETIEYSKSLLASEYYALSSTADDKKIAPANAYVTYEEDKFIVIPEDEGNQLDHHTFLLEINDIVSASGTKVVAADYDIYARPSIYRDSEDLAKECEQLNQLAVVSITYTLPNGEEKVLDGNEVRNWLNVDEQGNYTISEEEMRDEIAAFVKQFASEINTAGRARTLKSTMQGEITVEGGSYGWKIDQKAEAAQLAEEIANHSVLTREPVYATRELTEENDGIGNTYIEIDMTNQHLWYYIDGQLYVESDIVSGTYYNSGRRTPPGVFLLTFKQRNKVLRGRQQPDGTYEYESPVSFWMPFNGGIGLHDATWRGSFGGTIYHYSGSHGCINMPYKNAEKVYEKIDKETPIICYY